MLHVIERRRRREEEEYLEGLHTDLRRQNQLVTLSTSVINYSLHNEKVYFTNYSSAKIITLLIELLKVIHIVSNNSKVAIKTLCILNIKCVEIEEETL